MVEAKRSVEALVWAAVAATSPEEVRVAKAERGTARATAATVGAAAARLRKVAHYTSPP